MQKKCDIYLCEPTRTDRLRFIRLFYSAFQYDKGKVYSGYLGLDVDRVKLISVVSDLRKNSVVCFSVPVEYRENGKVSFEFAAGKASEHAKMMGASAVASEFFKQNCPPLYWIFELKNNEKKFGKAGGVIMVDRIDGHIWSLSEYEEYMYDFNNVL